MLWAEARGRPSRHRHSRSRFFIRLSRNIQTRSRSSAGNTAFASRAREDSAEGFNMRPNCRRGPDRKTPGDRKHWTEDVPATLMNGEGVVFGRMGEAALHPRIDPELVGTGHFRCIAESKRCAGGEATTIGKILFWGLTARRLRFPEGTHALVPGVCTLPISPKNETERFSAAGSCVRCMDDGRLLVWVSRSLLFWSSVTESQAAIAANEFAAQ